MATDNDIKIDLSKSLNPEAFSETSNILQNAAFSRLLEIINAHSEQLKLSEGKTYATLRSHNSVFISGGRGSGKTTFLLNIATVIKNKLENPPCILDIIDPTLIHDNDNFLSIVLGRIADTVKKRNSDLQGDRNGNSARDFFNKLSEVAELSEAICNSRKSTGLDNILDEQNALNLEQGIHELMKKAVDVLHCSFLVLPIDDIDMSFVHGVEVLEKIRKYLATPYIMPVISGDIEMYHRIFTIEFFRQMTHNDRISGEGIKRLYSKIDRTSQTEIENDSEAKDMYFISKSYDLSDRYLEKVLPRNRRIRLINVRDIVNEENIRVKVNEGHKWNGQSISNIVAQIKESFSLHCGYAMRDNNVFNSKDAPVPFNNLREFFQFLAQIKDAFAKENICYALLNKRIMDFYEYGGGVTDRTIFDFARANCNAYGGEIRTEIKDKGERGIFSIKRFAKFLDIEKYFPYSESQNKLVPFYPKPTGDYDENNNEDTSKISNRKIFEKPRNNLEKLFYIITYEADIPNGSRIYVSPDKFFLWITAKLFSPSDIVNNTEKYSFGFDNEIFMNDNKRIQKGNSIDDDGDEEVKERADDYERIKYEESTNKELYVDELGHFENVDCSSSFIYCMYDKFRANVDKILSDTKKVDKNQKGFPFSKFAKKLIIVYVNAFAVAFRAQKPRFFFLFIRVMQSLYRS